MEIGMERRRRRRGKGVEKRGGAGREQEKDGGGERGEFRGWINRIRGLRLLVAAERIKSHASLIYRIYISTV